MTLILPRGQVLTLDSGAVLLMFTNSLDKTEKYPMSVAVSLDNGASFPYVRDLQVGKQPHSLIPSSPIAC